MKDPTRTAKLLDLPYAPEAEEYLDELERSGQFRIGVEAEVAEDEEKNPAHAQYLLRRGGGHVVANDWWTAGSIDVRVGAGIAPDDVVLARHEDSLVVRTRDGADGVTIDNYLGLIPDAATLRVIFADGSEWRGGELLSRIAGWLVEVAPPEPPAG